jgi:hypothetical protein
MRETGKVGAVLAALVAVCAARTGAAQPPVAPCASSDGSPVVMIADSSRRPQMEPFVASIASQLGDLPVCFRVVWRDDGADEPGRGAEVAREIADATGAVVVFRLAPAPQSYQLRLFLTSRGGEREIERDVDVAPEGKPEETVAVIVRASIATAIEDSGFGEPAGGAVSTPAPAPGAPAPPPVPPAALVEDRAVPSAPEPHAPGPVALGAAYLIGLTGVGTTPTQGAQLDIGVRIAGAFSLHAGYLALAPLDVSSQGIDLELRRHPVRVGGRFSLAHNRLELRAGAAVGIDTVAERFHATDPDAVLAAAQGLRVQVSVAPDLALGIRLNRRLYATVSLSAEVVCNQVRYAVREDGQRKTVYDPWVVQPALAIGLELRLP